MASFGDAWNVGSGRIPMTRSSCRSGSGPVAAGATGYFPHVSALRISSYLSALPHSHCRDIGPLVLHAPTPNGHALERIEHQMLDQQANHDYRSQPRENAIRIQLVAILKDIPAKPTAAGTRAEYEFGGDQRAPRKGPAHAQAGKNRRQGGRHQDQQHMAYA